MDLWGILDQFVAGPFAFITEPFRCLPFSIIFPINFSKSVEYCHVSCYELSFQVSELQAMPGPPDFWGTYSSQGKLINVGVE